MGIIFKVRDFAYPFSILKLRRTFEKNQWLSAEALHDYQLRRLRQVVSQAYENVPYYRESFRTHGVHPTDIRTVNDLKHFPFLNRELLRENFAALVARNAKKYKPSLLSTSGTTGGCSKFFSDKSSNVLEFVYYWRFWGWAGYRLGDIFADWDVEFFPFFKKKPQAYSHFNPLTGKLTLNSHLLSPRRVEDFRAAFRKFKPVFLKGLPSNLFMLALLLQERKDHGIRFRAVFAQGEMLLAHQRDLIETTFSCKVYDSYGLMERITAISQCPVGTYHLHPDYGITELVEPELPVTQDDSGTRIREIVGTSLYNYSMPLIRYRTRDFARLSLNPGKCSCQRGFPAVASLLGRAADTIITPDRRAVTALYLVFDHTPGIIAGQIVQEEIDRLLVRMVSNPEECERAGQVLVDNLRSIVGSAMKISIEHTTVERLRKDNPGKFKIVVSRIPYEKIFS